MSMGKREDERQSDLWLVTSDLAQSPGHPFYERLNAVLREAEFDPRTEALCEPYYVKGKGRPGIPPGVYFRMQLVGYFEGISSERGIAWRCADSLALRAFLGYALDEPTPDSSSMCRIRQRLDVEVHEAVFQMVLEILEKRGLLRGKTIGIDATTLEANAALRSIVRRDDGTGYEDFLKKLAKESGNETPTRSDLAKIDKKRPRKGSNDDWEHPQDPDAQITKMKDGRTHLAHKSEHAVDMDSGAVLAVTLHGGAAGDTKTLSLTMQAACEQSIALGKDEPQEWVADKGYHSNETMELMEELDLSCAELFGPRGPSRMGRRVERFQESPDGSRTRSVPRGEAQLSPGAAVDDGDLGHDVLDEDAALSKLCLVDEEGSRRGVGEQQAKRLAREDQIEPDLRRAARAKLAIGATPVGVAGHRADAIERTAVWLAILIEGARAAVAEDASLDVLAQRLAGLELEAVRAHGEVSDERAMEDLAQGLYVGSVHAGLLHARSQRSRVSSTSSGSIFPSVPARASTVRYIGSSRPGTPSARSKSVVRPRSHKRLL